MDQRCTHSLEIQFSASLILNPEVDMYPDTRQTGLDYMPLSICVRLTTCF